LKIGIISDIHSNIHALEAVLPKLNGCDEVQCLGDIVGYGAFPNECVERLRSEGIPSIMGNHDAACVGLLSLGWFNPYAAMAARWTIENLGPQNHTYLRELPRSRRHESFYMVHGSPREPTTEYLTEPSQARASFSLCEEKLILVGHTHIPLAFMEREEIEAISPVEGMPISYAKRRLIYNPGSVGQPRDGDPRAAYAIVDTSTERIEVFRMEYDVGAAREAIIGAGLPRILGDRLAVGR